MATVTIFLVEDFATVLFRVAFYKSIIRYLSGTECPFIVHVYAVFADNDTEEFMYLVMSLCDGIDLQMALASGKNFPAEQVVFFIAQAIVALRYIHEKGWIHRDIKLENMVLEKSGYVRILDFGVAETVKLGCSWTRWRVDGGGCRKKWSAIRKEMSHFQHCQSHHI